MDTLLNWARGPFFWAALTFMFLGLARHVLVTLREMVRVSRRAGDKSVPYRKITAATLSWLFPLRQLRNRTFYGLTSLVFHVAIVLVPIFLAGHIALWKGGVGISWPAIPNLLSDVLTLAAIVAVFLLVVQRATARDTRSLSRFQDYFLPLYIAIPLVTGFLVVHPAWNPFPYEITMLVHVMSANILLILTPMTKLSHVVLLPSTQLVSELAWHWPPDTGRKVGMALGKEGEPV